MSTNDQAVLLESRTMRARVCERVEVLDKVKALQLLPDGMHVTTALVAEYFEVEFEAIKKIVQRHREELESNGMTVLRGEALVGFERDILSLSNKSYPQALRSNLTLLNRRAVLNVAMLLRDSDVARRVRVYLLDVEESTQAAPGVLERYVTELAATTAARVACEIVDARIDARLKPHTEVIGALSVKVTNVECAIGAVQDTLAGVREELAELRAECGVRLRRRRCR
ncbi:restriction endonuclease [Streptacidiphilus pinicola]|uniref:Restriction endonuclease n=1 Tax=Streptacidiphilus pinicola TaxID=2219663 RepID=A0A2X0IIK2_9ACTN|nr:restriction endonuclease [Streptacidiphilus pinicola]RAG84902.1 restriction endonuclease [Streptacidiphilus pinicola]